MYMAYSLSYGEEDVLINAKPREYCIDINANSASGILNIHPFNKEIKADLENKKYGLNTMIYYNGEFPPLIYSISDLNKDIKAEFYYKPIKIEPIKIESGDKNYILKNPFEICSENEESDCKKNISEYTFIKGKNYKIKVLNEFVEFNNYYYMTEYSFSKKDEITDETDEKTEETDKTDETDEKTVKTDETDEKTDKIGKGFHLMFVTRYNYYFQFSKFLSFYHLNMKLNFPRQVMLFDLHDLYEHLLSCLHNNYFYYIFLSFHPMKNLLIFHLLK